MRFFLSFSFLCASVMMGAQTTPAERLFIDRANEVRDSLGLPPLQLMGKYRKVSLQHAAYISRTGDVSHSQDKRLVGGRVLENMSDRVHEYGPAGVGGWSEIITYVRHDSSRSIHYTDSAMAVRSVQNFMGSKPHRVALLNDWCMQCTVGIMKKKDHFVCVVNFFYPHGGGSDRRAHGDG